MNYELTKIKVVDSFSNSNIKLNIEEIENKNKNNINIIICYLNYLYDVNTISKNYLIGCNFLIKNQKFIPYYDINYQEGFKFKKYIRETIKKEFKFRNSDILHIKTINNTKYNHNYLVLVDNSIKNISKFKNMMHINNKTDFCWRSIYNIYYPSKINVSKKDIFDDLSKNASYKFKFENAKNHKFSICDVYKSLSMII